MRYEGRESVIRAIVASSFDAYFAGFFDYGSSENNTEEDFCRHSQDAIVVGNGFENTSFTVLALSFYKILMIVASRVAKFSYNINCNSERRMYERLSDCITEVRQNQEQGRFSKNGIYKNHAFWNCVCKSDYGYDIVTDEYRKCVNNLFGLNHDKNRSNHQGFGA